MGKLILVQDSLWSSGCASNNMNRFFVSSLLPSLSLSVSALLPTNGCSNQVVTFIIIIVHYPLGINTDNCSATSLPASISNLQFVESNALFAPSAA